MKFLKFKDYLNESISKFQLRHIEDQADKWFKKWNIDIEFTHHFFDRVNDLRNEKSIEAIELIQLFKKTEEELGKDFSHIKDIQAVLKDISSDINIPFILEPTKDGIRFISKTVMRKKNFMTSNPIFKINT